MGRWDSWKLKLPGSRSNCSASNSSEGSCASRASNASSNSSEDPFVFSPLNTPGKDEAAPRQPASGNASQGSTFKGGLLFGKAANAHRHESTGTFAPPDDGKSSSTGQTKQIAIEHPKAPKIDSSPASTSNPLQSQPPGEDNSSGYFPPLEDAEAPLQAPRSFRADSGLGRQHSTQQGAESSRSGSSLRKLNTAKMSEKSKSSLPNTAIATAPRYTPLSSYNPIGVHDGVVLPLGKYYPSNWERRHAKPNQSRPLAPQPPPAVARSEPQAPTYQGHGGGDQGASSRPGSEVQRRLQQYQRDMVAQAAMAASAILASSGGGGGGGGGGTASSLPPPSTTTSPSGIALARAQLGAKFLRAHRPVSPQLRPLGSPGPVTPMSLEGDGYLSVRPAAVADGGGEVAVAPGPGPGPALSSSKLGGHRNDACSPSVGVSALSV
ncbi:hypothetical protein VTK26DRAFT_682 [Humicola hyalothermophila]